MALKGTSAPKRLILSGCYSNSSEILCPSWLPASLTKILSKMNMLAWRLVPFSHYMGNFLSDQGHLTLKGMVQSGRNSKSSETVFITCKFDALRHHFPHYVNGSFLFMATRVLMESALKPKHSLSPIPLMIHTKFDQHWPTGLREIHV